MNGEEEEEKEEKEEEEKDTVTKTYITQKKLGKLRKKRHKSRIMHCSTFHQYIYSEVVRTCICVCVCVCVYVCPP